MTLFLSPPSFWRDRLIASAIHFGLSICIAAFAGLLVFGLWYPYPYREISGGRELFLLMVVVDVTLGPLITFAVFNRRKTVSELQRDLGIVGLVQLAALMYGLWTVAVARPVHMVFEIDRFRVVHAVDVPLELLPFTPVGVNALPLTGPTMLALRPFKDDEERMDATAVAVKGVHLGVRPDLWQPYENSVADVLKEALPVSRLKILFPLKAGEIDRALAAVGRTAENTVYLPLVARKSFWTVFLNPVNADVVATIPLDPF